MNTEEKSQYFQELARNLQHAGFTTGEEENGLLPVELDGQPLCFATENGGVRYWMEDVSGDSQSVALDRVTAIARVTAEYTGQMEVAPLLEIGSLRGSYKMLAEFNGTVLAGKQTRYGAQFITWSLSPDRTALSCGHYFGPGVGVDGYTSAKRDFALRAGLIHSGALFTPEQLAEVYRCICKTLDSGCLIADAQHDCLVSVAEQIERSVPDLEERTEHSDALELEAASPVQDRGMQFC